MFCHYWCEILSSSYIKFLWILQRFRYSVSLICFPFPGLISDCVFVVYLYYYFYNFGYFHVIFSDQLVYFMAKNGYIPLGFWLRLYWICNELDRIDMSMTLSFPAQEYRIFLHLFSSSIKIHVLFINTAFLVRFILKYFQLCIIIIIIIIIAVIKGTIKKGTFGGDFFGGTRNRSQKLTLGKDSTTELHSLPFCYIF